MVLIQQFKLASPETADLKSCEVHGKRLEAFCSTCMQLLCIDCLIQNNDQHKTHEILSIEKASLA